MTGGQISYDLPRLRAHQIVERIPHSRSYQVTAGGLTIALFLTRLTQRLLIPGLAQLTSPGRPGRSRLRQADRAYRDALTDLARHASLAAVPHLQLSLAVITSEHPPVISRHTRRNLTRNSKFLRGKITYDDRCNVRRVLVVSLGVGVGTTGNQLMDRPIRTH